MINKTCTYQHVYYETSHQVFIGSCVNPACIHHCMTVGDMICNECPNKRELNEADRIFLKALSEVDTEDMPQRSEEDQAATLETYCFKCIKFDHFAKTCTDCSCTLRMPIDDFVKHEHLHCPLELW